MSTTTFYLILTFWSQGFGQSWSPAFSSQMIPGYTASACQAAGEEAKKSFNGGGNVNWACVPAPKSEDPS